MKITSSFFIVILILLTATETMILREYSDSCNNFDGENACRGNQTDNADDWKKRNFQTPPRGDPLWRPQYQDYDKLVGYARTQYNSAKTSSNVTVYTQINEKHTGVSLIYSFNGVNQSSNILSVDNNQK
jgi:alpha-amylase